MRFGAISSEVLYERVLVGDCSCHHLTLFEAHSTIPQGRNSIAVAVRDGHTPASTVVLGGWLRSLLQLAGVSASAGSVHFAVPPVTVSPAAR
jgi:hypothetical protein